MSPVRQGGVTLVTVLDGPKKTESFVKKRFFFILTSGGFSRHLELPVKKKNCVNRSSLKLDERANVL